MVIWCEQWSTISINYWFETEIPVMVWLYSIHVTNRVPEALLQNKYHFYFTIVKDTESETTPVVYKISCDIYQDIWVYPCGDLQENTARILFQPQTFTFIDIGARLCKHITRRNVRLLRAIVYLIHQHICLIIRRLIYSLMFSKDVQKWNIVLRLPNVFQDIEIYQNVYGTRQTCQHISAFKPLPLCDLT